MDKQRAQEILTAAQERGAVVSLYRTGSPHNYGTGFVLAVSDHHLVFASINYHGRYDGWHLRALDELCRVDSGGRYEDKVLSLYRAREQNHRADFLPPTDLSSDLVSELLQAAQGHEIAVRLYTGQRGGINGFVREIGSSTVSIDVHDDYGQADGEAVVDLESIRVILVDDEEAQDLKILARWHDAPPL